MKKLICALVLFVALSGVANAATFEKNLYFGLQSDSEVSKLQEFLTSENLYSGPITGNFFSLTLKAVKAFQLRESISPVSGYFGPMTRAKANLLIDAEVGVSENQAIVETGTPTQPTQSIYQQQLAKLMEQAALLQAQLNSQLKTEQTINELKSAVVTQGQTLQQIQVNTAPVVVPQPAPTPAPTHTPTPTSSPNLGGVSTTTPSKINFKVVKGGDSTGWDTKIVAESGVPSVELKSIRLVIMSPSMQAPYSLDISFRSDSRGTTYQSSISSESNGGTGYHVSKQIDIPVNMTISNSYERFNLLITNSPITPGGAGVISWTFEAGGQEYTYTPSDF